MRVLEEVRFNSFLFPKAGIQRSRLQGQDGHRTGIAVSDSAFTLLPSGIVVLLSDLVVKCNNEPYREYETGEMKKFILLFVLDCVQV